MITREAAARRTTMSALDRLFACPASGALPGRDIETKWRRRGTAIHKYRQLRGEGATEQIALAQIDPEFRGDCRDLVLDDLPPTAEHEVAYALDIFTGQARRLVGCEERNYGAYNLDALEIPGTLDVQYLDGDTIVVIDYKSGGGKHVQPLYSATMMAYGYCAWKVSGARFCRLVYRNTDFGSDLVSEVDAFAFEDWLDEMRATQRRIVADQSAVENGEDPIVTPGDHCRYCPAITASCPAKRELVQMAHDGEIERRTDLLYIANLNDDAVAAEAYAFWSDMTIFAKRLGEALHARAAARPIPTRPGYMYGQRETRGRETLDGGVVWDVVAEQWGEEIADKAVELRTTKKALKLALKDAVPSGGVAAAERAALKAVRDRGGAVKGAPGTKFEEMEIPKLKAVK